ncbi:shikimate dehydrogenase [Schaalia vaccimaxillae]|uniref:shikimate dehydrogenase n=1 Tax=Schaalia vaccimaxillae TaxID=183916 RepID=UPI0003B69B0E|nr:shikimate dehydrogenase [Schaalia vaccimaxillae]
MPWAAVIGSPIEHSLSPVLHRAAWDSIGLDGTWVYDRIEVQADEAVDFVRTLDSQCRGLSVTMPCKQVIIPALDALDPLAHAVGAVNTVIPSAGVLTGFNTDVHGIVTALRQAREEADLPQARSAVILGARATASSALAALGTLGIARSTVIARRFGGPGSVVPAAARLGVSIDEVMWSDTAKAASALQRADIIISTVPAGAADELTSVWTPSDHQSLLDVTYNQPRSALRQACESAGACIAEATNMLIHQAALQVRLMTGHDPNIDVMRQALKDASA